MTRFSLPPALILAAILVGPLFSPSDVTAQVAGPKLSQAQAGYYRLKIGDVEVTALSDGTIGLDTKLLQTPHRAAIDKALKGSFLTSPLDTSVNAYLLNLRGRLILIDAGAGTLFGPSLNKLSASLTASGVEPAQITDVLLTHVHTDHTGGLTDGTRRIFPNATVHLDRRELAFWLDQQNEARAPADMKAFFQQARASLKPYVDSDRIQTFDGVTEVIPGIFSVPAPGHTPGHTFYKVESKGERIDFWGDVLHVAQVQFQNPSVTIAYDVDPKAAAAQRKRAFADAASKGYFIAPSHMPYPGVGHLIRDKGMYRWIPLQYVNDAMTSSP
jgi:glyoxylase-like metal-dependent hydrolase (beta-lactamase superfamily II)